MRILIAIIIVVIIISLIILIRTEKHEVVYVRSNIDGNTYLVRDLPDKQEASDMLSQIKININKIVEELYNNKDSKYKDFKDNIEQLKTRIQNVIINESSGDSEYTSYSVNKGEQLVFCLRSKYDGNFHDLNLMMYVTLHEISHIASPTYGHDDNFKRIFAFITKVAIDNGIYKKIDFYNDNREYCGLTISESII